MTSRSCAPALVLSRSVCVAYVIGLERDKTDGFEHVLGMTFTLGGRRAATLVAVVAGFLVAGGATAASASEPLSIDSSAQCSTGQFCLWSGTVYTGVFASISSTATANVTSVPVARSVRNLTGRAVRLYSGAGGTGSFVCYGSGADLANTSVGSGSVQIQAGTVC